MPAEHESEHTIEIYVHVEGAQDPELAQVPSSCRVADLLSEGERLWLQDGAEPVPDDSLLPVAGISRRSHVHRSRCNEVKVRVRHAGEDRIGEFSPAARVIRVFRWATGPKGFKLPEAQIPKHGLALPEADELLDPGVHIGSLVSEVRCIVTVDLVPKDRFAG